jgi:hypothetical protein
MPSSELFGRGSKLAERRRGLGLCGIPGSSAGSVRGRLERSAASK